MAAAAISAAASAEAVFGFLQFLAGLLGGILDAGRRADHGGVVLGQPRFQAGHLGGNVLLGFDGRLQGCPIAFRRQQGIAVAEGKAIVADTAAVGSLASGPVLSLTSLIFSPAFTTSKLARNSFSSATATKKAATLASFSVLPGTTKKPAAPFSSSPLSTPDSFLSSFQHADRGGLNDGSQLLDLVAGLVHVVHRTPGQGRAGNDLQVVVGCVGGRRRRKARSSSGNDRNRCRRVRVMGRVSFARMVSVSQPGARYRALTYHRRIVARALVPESADLNLRDAESIVTDYPSPERFMVRQSVYCRIVLPPRVIVAIVISCAAGALTRDSTPL